MIQFHEDHFTYDEQRRGFFLDEPDTLLDQNTPPGVIDVWTKSADLE